MTPATWNTVVVKGDTLAFTVMLEAADGVAIDLTGYTVAAQVRRYASEVGVPLATYTCTIVDHPAPPETMDDPSNRAVQVELSSSATAQLPAADLVHDLVFTPPSGGPTTCLYGILSVRGRVTR